jgi:hypothetical protein
MEPALGMPFVKYPEKTWQKLALAVIDQIFEASIGLKKVGKGSPYHVLLRRLFNVGLLIIHWIHAAMIEIRFLIQYLNEVSGRCPRRWSIIFSRFGVEP